MSIPVDLTALEHLIAAIDGDALLISVSDGSRPHVVSVLPIWSTDTIVVGAGRRTTRNVADRSDVTLIWTTRHDEHYRLIVDGTAEMGASDQIVVTPTAAVLHRVAGAGTDDTPNCVPVE